MLETKIKHFCTITYHSSSSTESYRRLGQYHKYEPLKRHQVAGPLLDAHFASNQKHGLEALLSDVDTYGLGIFGDGATIVRTPMMNILASSPNNPCCVLDVVECSNQIAEGSKRMLGILLNYPTHLKNLILTIKTEFLLLLLVELRMSKRLLTCLRSTFLPLL